MNHQKPLFVVLTILLLATFSGWGEHATEHSDPVVPILLALTIITTLALLARYIARQLDQPCVLGELALGIMIGNIGYWIGSDLISVLRESTAVFNAINLSLEGGVTLEEALSHTLGEGLADELLPILTAPQGGRITDAIQVIDGFSRIGLLFLLFAVGLESSAGELRAAASSATRVAIIGVAAPFILGLGAMQLFAPHSDWSANLMVAIALCATSIGITARVFHELNRDNSEVSHVVLSAAVIDDVLGLILMAIGIDIIFRGSIDLISISYSIMQAIMFLASIYLLVPKIIQFTVSRLHHFKLWEAELFVSFLLLTSLSWLADFVGLSAIVGAFAAGLILSNREFTYWKKGCDPEREACSLDQEVKEQIRPFEAILAPIFFVLMGMQVKLEVFLDQEIMILATALTLVAIAGKLLSGLGARHELPRLAIGAGMVPRGEVALILAAVGKGLGILDPSLFSAVVVMAIITSLTGPPLLKWSLTRAESQ